MLLTEALQRLTAEQLSELEESRTYWRNIGLSLSQTDRATAELGLVAAYRAAGLSPPTITIWLKSPRAGATAARLLGSDLDWPWQLDPTQRAVWDQVWQQCVRQIEEIVGPEAWAAVRRQMRKEADKKILDKYGHLVEKRIKEVFSERLGIWVWQYLRKMAGNSVLQQIRIDSEDAVRAAIADKASHAVFDEVFQELVPPLKQQVYTHVAEPLRLMMTINNGILTGRQTAECAFGQHDASWVAYYDYLSKIGVKGAEMLDGITRITQSCGWWWPYEKLCVMTDRPSQMVRDNRGKLHCETGMCIKYGDGWGFYAWHGVIVPDYVILLPEPITLEMIEAEPNVEVRRVLIERFGLDNYLKERQVIKIHQDKCGILYRMNLQGDEPVLVVHVVNSSPEPDGSYKEYFLRVPPTMTRARQAIAWTFGLTEEEYEPLSET
jgi:hypothetical protein